MGKKTGSVSGMNKQDHNSESLENKFFGVKILKLFDADPGSGIKNSDPGSGMEKIRIRDPGLTSRIRITAQIQSFSYWRKRNLGPIHWGLTGAQSHELVTVMVCLVCRSWS
jgi:hypothetical protein